jgi:hypothetical protein
LLLVVYFVLGKSFRCGRGQVMKRDMNIVKRLLLLIEEKEDDRNELKIPVDIDINIAVYHMKILDQAGYIESKVQYADNKPYWISASLTWDGQEFLGALKNEKALERAKDLVKGQGSKLSDLPFEIVKSLLIASSKQLLGL